MTNSALRPSTRRTARDALPARPAVRKNRTGCPKPRTAMWIFVLKPFAKLKAFLRKLAERTVAGLAAALEVCADLFKPCECENYFESCGYDPAEFLEIDTTSADSSSPHISVRPDGACCQWRKVPPRELSMDLVSDERSGWATSWA